MNMSNGTHHQVEMSGHGEMSRQTEDSTVFVQKGKTIRYDLYVTDTVVNFTGKKKHAYAINGSLPAPTLTFTEGDTAEIYLHNQLKSEETSLHWHGVILPNQFDGVPYLTTARSGPAKHTFTNLPLCKTEPTGIIRTARCRNRQECMAH